MATLPVSLTNKPLADLMSKNQGALSRHMAVLAADPTVPMSSGSIMYTSHDTRTGRIVFTTDVSVSTKDLWKVADALHARLLTNPRCTLELAHTSAA